ncbi:MAG: N-acetylmannosamine-6-phosphate 2-epimerase [Microbacteriaceae bacterium]|nr:MAG: N-acetylmannosamine-6-phosphate 2-epimerase [Microbacteriaceae bacterium]
MLETIRGGLIVSCQAYPGEPLHNPQSMLFMAQSAARGGAAGIRAQGLEEIRLIHDSVPLPLIGLVKVPGDDVFITPTLNDALAVAAAGADIIALDGTRRQRPDRLSLAETVRALHETTGLPVMADCGSLDDGIAAQDAGADLIGTTLAGYTTERRQTQGPDLSLIGELAARLSAPVMAEGRIQSPADARAAIDAGAFAVTVGTAITHPTTITSWFVQAIQTLPAQPAPTGR